MVSWTTLALSDKQKQNVNHLKKDEKLFSVSQTEPPVGNRKALSPLDPLLTRNVFFILTFRLMTKKSLSNGVVAPPLNLFRDNLMNN